MNQWLRSYSIRSIILLSFLPFTLLILLTYYGFYRIGSEQLKQQTYENARNINAQIATSLSQGLDTVYQAASEITSNLYFYEMKQNIENNRTPVISPLHYYQLYERIDRLVSSAPDYFSSISLFLDDRSIFVHRSNMTELVRDISFSYEVSADAIRSDSLTLVIPEHAHPYEMDDCSYSHLGLMMVLGNASSELHGFLFFEINDDFLLERIQNVIITPSSRFGITCGKELLLDNHDDSSAGSFLLPVQDFTNGGVSAAPFSDGDNCYFYTPVPTSEKDLQLGVLSQVPLSEISLNQKALTHAFFFAIAFFFLLCGLIYAVISRTVTQPLRHLNDCLSRSYDITIPSEFHASGSREIETITKTLNRFCSHIHQLVQNLNHEMNERRIAELNILYEQINPHFLYNALDTIYQLCDMGDMDSAKEMTHSLATFYRIGVSKGVSYISLKEECTHADVYLSIMKIRFENFTYEIHLPEELDSCITIKQILQPLLENAIYHGVHQLYDRPGHIVISVSEQKTCLVITVADNGIGIPEDDLAAIQTSLDQKFDPVEKGKLYGLKNVHARLRLTWREPYGLSVKSVPDEGTEIIITIPKITQTSKGDFIYDENTVC